MANRHTSITEASAYLEACMSIMGDMALRCVCAGGFHHWTVFSQHAMRHEMGGLHLLRCLCCNRGGHCSAFHTRNKGGTLASPWCSSSIASRLQGYGSSMMCWLDILLVLDMSDLC